jgi:NitT/TauT family transport system ATP-binding protein
MGGCFFIRIIIMSNIILDIQNITVQYETDKEKKIALYNASLQLMEGDRTVVLGPSGSGKSTMMKVAGANIIPISGQVLLEGVKITKPSIKVMNVFQGFDQLAPWMTVVENVKFPLIHGLKMSKKEAHDKAMAFLGKVKLTALADSFPHQLSGGQYTRVAIARGFAVGAKVLLMDEPFAPLDALTRRQMQDELRILMDENGGTLMFITHDIAEAVKLGSRIVVLSANPGQIIEEIQGVESGECKALEKRISDLIQH